MENSTLEEYYGTLSQTINALNRLGYDLDFNVKEECLVCHQISEQLSPEDFQIDKVYRFEGASDPEDQSILYAISSTKHNKKGILVNGYGIASDDQTSNIISKLRTNDNFISLHIKQNNATPQRPDNNRLIFAPKVEIDLNEMMNQLISEASWSEKGHNSMSLFKSDKLRIVLMGFKKNEELKAHSTKGIISVQVIRGRIKFTVDGESSDVQTGQMIVLDSGITHSVIAVEESFILLTIGMGGSSD